MTVLQSNKVKPKAALVVIIITTFITRCFSQQLVMNVPINLSKQNNSQQVKLYKDTQLAKQFYGVF